MMEASGIGSKTGESRDYSQNTRVPPRIKSRPLTRPAAIPNLPPRPMAEIHTADLSSLDTDALKSRLTQLGRYL